MKFGEWAMSVWLTSRALPCTGRTAPYPWPSRSARQADGTMSHAFEYMYDCSLPGRNERQRSHEIVVRQMLAVRATLSWHQCVLRLTSWLLELAAVTTSQCPTMATVLASYTSITGPLTCCVKFSLGLGPPYMQSAHFCAIWIAVPPTPRVTDL